MKPRGSRRERRWQGSKKTSSSDYFITGLNGVRECLRSPSVYVSRMWIEGDAAAWLKQHLPDLEHLPITPESADGGETPFGLVSQGCAVLVKPPRWGNWMELVERPMTQLIVALDQVEDPMNLGQIVRTCEAAGVSGIILPERRSAQLNQTVAQVSQGAFAWLPVFDVGNLRRSLDKARDCGYHIVGAEYREQARSWSEIKYSGRVLLVLGSEGRGLRRLTQEACDDLAFLPIVGRVDSLNVSAATAAMVYEILRQQAAE